ncbi:hypothetical protein NJBCHELONAE_12210 [Mycobacteroides chelonae]|nr:hypothetical protein NJBCHELONAE_12210 [Mycobacteroides chelonae]
MIFITPSIFGAWRVGVDGVPNTIDETHRVIIETLSDVLREALCGIPQWLISLWLSMPTSSMSSLGGLATTTV